MTAKRFIKYAELLLWFLLATSLNGAIRFFLNQAERKDVPQNGSAARFDNLGLYLFDTEKEANDFVKAYKNQKQ